MTRRVRPATPASHPQRPNQYQGAEVGQGGSGDIDPGLNVPWDQVTERPTTLGGYGILDAYTNTETDALLADKADITDVDAALALKADLTDPVFPASVTVDGLLQLGASETGEAKLNMPDGVAPTAPNDGDVWREGDDLFVRLGTDTYKFDLTIVGGGPPPGSFGDYQIKAFVHTTGAGNVAPQAFDTDVVAGDKIVVALCTFNSGNVPMSGVTDSDLNSYAPALVVAVSTNKYLEVYTAIAANSGPLTVAPGVGPTHATGFMVAVTGPFTNPDDEVHTVGSLPGSGNTITTSSISPSGNAVLLSFIIGYNSDGTFDTPLTPFDELFNDPGFSSYNGLISGVAVVAPGTYDCSWDVLTGSGQPGITAIVSLNA